MSKPKKKKTMQVNNYVLKWFNNHWLNIINQILQSSKVSTPTLPSCWPSLWGRGSGTFLPDGLNRLENPHHITAIVRAALLSQSKDQNSSHVSKEQMSYQLGWCEHRYNADRKLRQSLVQPIMGRAVGAGLQTPLFLHCAALWYMINFLTKSTQATLSLSSL